jgi:hypothetical protein
MAMQIMEARVLSTARTHGVSAQDRTNAEMDRKVEEVKEVKEERKKGRKE